MPSEDRYEIIDTIAQGDYAVVCRARDSELRREVAVKQIHAQYLQDPSKLDQYWKEAQLLASLEHPYIMTIYDIDRSRGWLILELMKGSLKQQLAGNPIDLESLRLSLIYMLHALSFLEKNHIIHGDVKPSNLMLDKNNRVKLGDFGIARRVTGDDGSVVKGTTKYMAPEVVSDQFGAVGPQSDLYSLGFSAFELMCGNHFDTLFPGLNMFGRDQQIAWMMWHSALDRRLPEISRVLEGVPDDLAYVIQKLTEKEPSKRYRSAEAVLDDLRASNQGEMPGAAEAAAAEAAVEAAAQQKKKKLLVYGALAVSLCLTVGMMFLPSGKQADDVKQVDSKPTRGIVDGIDLARESFAVRAPNAKTAKEIKVGPQDRIELNRQRVTLADLRVDDDVRIEDVIRKVDGKEVEAQEIIATRPEGVQTESYVAEIDASSSVITLEPEQQGGTPLKIYVPRTVQVWLNNADTIDGRKTNVGDLSVGDIVRLTHVKGDRERVATSLRAKHVDTFSGTIVEIDPGNRTLTVQSNVANDTLSLPLSDQCTITLNGIKTYPNGVVVSLNNLEKGYEVSIKHDTHISDIDANHSFTHTGVVQAVDMQAGTVSVTLNDASGVVRFSVTADTIISVDSEDPVDLSYLRANDKVTISHASADLVDPLALQIAVDPISDPRTWSIVIGRSKYERLPKTTAEIDVQRVAAALRVHYRVPESQNLILLNKSIDELRPEITGRLAEVPADSQLFVYYIGHAFQKDGVPYLAEEFTNFYKLDGGLALQWLVDELEACQANEKILLLDLCHKVGQNFEAMQPSTAEFVALLSAGPTDPVSATVTVIASCRDGERGRLLDDQQSGRFAAVVSKALQGDADKNADLRVSADELYGYLEAAMARYQAGGRQTPAQFLPNPSPPRLSAAKKEAVMSLLAYLQVATLTDEIDVKLADARAMQPDQPDDMVAEGLLYLKDNRTRDSERVFAKIALEHPDLLIPHHVLAWQYFMQKKYKEGLEELYALVAAIPDEDAGDDRAAYYRQALEFAGVLRTFAISAPERPLRINEVSKLDNEIIRRGDQAKQVYAAGVNRVKPVVSDLLSRISLEPDQAKQDALTRELRRLTLYHRLDFGLLADYVRANLNH